MVDPTLEEWLESARRRVEAARLLLEGGYPSDAIQRTYYAVLHASRAVLTHHGMAPKTHAGVRRQLGRTPEVREHLDTKLVSTLLDERLDADYHLSTPASDHVADRLDEAEQFVAAAGGLV